MNSSIINVSPFGTNVLDLVDVSLVASDGSDVVVRRQGIAFEVLVDGVSAYITDDNLSVSAFLNQMEVSFL